MPALIQFVGASPGGRLLDEGLDPAVVVGRDDAVARRVVDRRQGDRRPRRRARRGASTRAPTSRSVSTSPLTTRKRGVDAGVDGREADGAGRVERLGLDRVVEPHARRRCRRGRRREGVGPVAEREDGIGDAVAAEVGHDPLDHRPVDDRQHLLGGGRASAAAGGCRSRRRGRSPSRGRRGRRDGGRRCRRRRADRAADGVASGSGCRPGVARRSIGSTRWRAGAGRPLVAPARSCTSLRLSSVGTLRAARHLGALGHDGEGDRRRGPR